MAKYTATWTCRTAGAIGLHATHSKSHTFEAPDCPAEKTAREIAEIRSAAWDTAPREWWDSFEHFALVGITVEIPEVK